MPDTFENVVELAALDDVAGYVTIPVSGARRAVMNPPIGVLQQLEQFEKMRTSGTTPGIARVIHILEQVMPDATPEEIASLRPSQIGIVIALALHPSATLSTYGRPADPNGVRGSASSSAPGTGSVTSSGALPPRPGGTPTA